MANALNMTPEDIEKFSSEFGLKMREGKSDHDYDKIAELWANLAMVQQIKGYTRWIDQQKESGLDWFPYIKTLKNDEKNRFIVIEDEKQIFGFAYLVVQPDSEEAGQVNGELLEIYLEPSEHLKGHNDELGEMLRSSIRDDLGVTYIEFKLDEIV